MSTPPPFPQMSAVQAPSESRLTSLDGLRGLAALVVVFHHLSLTLRPFSDVWIVPTAQHPPTGSLIWWFTSTPLQLLISGPEAVLVFFVLSGLVLTLPVLRRGAEFDWAGYYPQRIVRLYLPAIASILLSAIWVLTTSATTGASTSLWVQAYRFTGFDWARTLSGTDLLFGDNSLNNVLWTLRWEVLFSLVLPVAIVIVLALHRRWVVTVVGLMVLILVGEYSGLGVLQFLPVFLFGVLAAMHHPRLVAWTSDAANRARVRWGGLTLLIVSLLLLNIHWTAWGARWVTASAAGPARHPAPRGGWHRAGGGVLAPGEDSAADRSLPLARTHLVQRLPRARADHHRPRRSVRNLGSPGPTSCQSHRRPCGRRTVLAFRRATVAPPRQTSGCGIRGADTPVQRELNYSAPRRP